jgi:hypothetical protein
MNVVADGERSTQLYIRPATRVRTRCGLDGVPISRQLSYTERFSLPWVLGEGEWSEYHVLMLTPTGAAHSFWAIWDAAWEFQEWYVNLQEPLRRTRFGFDTADDVLDLVIEADGSWRWKDEDELEEAVAVGRFTSAEAAELRREGERALATYEARAWPFDRDWTAWRPGADWPAPALVEGSEEL